MLAEEDTDYGCRCYLNIIFKKLGSLNTFILAGIYFSSEERGIVL